MEPFTPAEEEQPIRPDWRIPVCRLARRCAWGSFGAFGAAAAAGVVWHSPHYLYLWFAGMALAGLAALLSLATIRAAGSEATFAAALALALIALPMAVVCAVFIKAKEQSLLSRSLNNIHQLAVAAQAYAVDYGGAFPGWVNDGTKASPRYVHNVWDQQLAPYMKSNDVYSNAAAGVRSPSQPGPKRSRVVSYGLNGMLICPPAPQCDGNAPFDAAGAKRPPAPLGPGAVSNSAGTILFAELAADRPMDGVYGQPVPPDERPRSGGSDWAGTREYGRAQPGWIDVSPRAFCELTNPPASNYEEPYGGATGRGIARNLYHGGGCYAFCDGHVQFLQLSKTVGIGQALNGTQVTARNCWSPLNTLNMWNPNVEEVVRRPLSVLSVRTGASHTVRRLRTGN